MVDSRKNPRCAFRWRGAIVLANDGKQETIQCKTSDISISGVSVICHRNIPIARAVTVYLLIDPGNGTRPQVIVEAQGSIMNNVLSGQQGGFRLGIQFTKFARDGRQILQDNLPKDLVRPAMRPVAAAVAPAKDVVKVADVAPAPEVVTVEDVDSAPDAVIVEDASPSEDLASAPDEASAA